MTLAKVLTLRPRLAKAAHFPRREFGDDLLRIVCRILSAVSLLLMASLMLAFLLALTLPGQWLVRVAG